MSGRPLPLEEQQRRNLVRLARNPATPAQWLATVPWTDQHRDRTLREALAANPSTPAPVLAKLIDSAPAAICRNPAASLLLLENPAFPTGVSVRGLVGLLRFPGAPFPIVAELAHGAGCADPRVADAARLHISQAPEVPDSDWAERIREYWVRADPHSPNDEERHLLCELVELELLPSGFLRNGQPDPLGTDDYAAVYRENPTWVERGRDNPPKGIPKRFLRGPELHRLRGAAFNPHVPGETLAGWTERDLWVDRAIAAHPHAPAEALSQLARHMDPAIRRRVLRNPNCSRALVEECRTRAVKRLLHAAPTLSLGMPRLLGRFAAMQRAPMAVYRPRLHTMADSVHWQDRMAAALAVGPRPSGRPPHPRHQLLLHRLAEDGIVLVRAAARARLRGETFSWQKGK